MITPQHERRAADDLAPPYEIQPALWPESEISTEDKPYLRLSGAAGLSLKNGGIIFASGGCVSTDTYFNLFNLGKWRALCGDMPLQLFLRGQGRFHLTIFVAIQQKSWVRIYSESVELKAEITVPIDLSEIVHSRAIIFFELTALSDGRLDDFAWSTTQAPRQSPSMLISVTTFRREAAIISTMNRFSSFIAGSPLRTRIHMNVVDNGQSVEAEPRKDIAIIRNANLGGAGGFSRGLLEARSANASHCLFMDDDASMHMGAITRTWWLLAYAMDPRTAVAGAMVNADHRWQIWENGAIFERGCRPQYFGCDMRDRQQVFEMEFDTTSPAPSGFYGGWWFFAFPVGEAIHMPFPFFVRGDDVSFSLANDFRIVTLPGVASVQESFTDKASPLTWYLDMRSHLAHHLSLPERRVGWLQLQKMFISFYVRTVLRYHYDSLSAVNLAIEDVLRGPRFFDDNIDMAQRRKDLKDLTVIEAWQPINSIPKVLHGKSSRLLRALLLLTLNGHLLPLSNSFGTKLVIEAQHRDNYREVYGAREIIYLNSGRSAAYTVRRDRNRFWAESLRLLKNSLKMRRRYAQLHQEWQGSYVGMTSEGFWQKKLGLGGALMM